MRKHWTAWAAAACVAAVATTASAEQTIFTLAATGQSSSYYAYHVAVAQLLQDKLGYNVTVQETGGGIENKRLLERGHADWGQFAEPDFYEFQRGIGAWEGKAQPNFRVLWLVNPIVYFPVVNKKMGIKSFEDLEGRKFSPGGRGSSTERMTQEFVETILGIKPDWFRGGYSDAVAAMKDRRIVGYMKSASISAPDATILDVRTAVDIDVLSWSEPQIAKIKERYPYYQFIELKDTPYNTGPVTVRSIYLAIGTTSDMSEEVAYKIVKTVSENVPFQAGSFPAIKGIDIPRLTLEGAKAPLHAGTVRYFREIGLTVPDELVPPEAK